MIVQELLKQADLNKQVELICNSQPSYEKPYDKEIVRENMDDFINMLLTLKPNKNKDNIIVYEKYWDTDLDDDIKEYSVSELYKKESFLACLDKVKNMEVPVTDYSLDMSKDELKALVMQCDFVPEGYAYEFNDWEDTLGYEVYMGNLSDESDKQNAIYNILYEMSFNGMTRDSQTERQEELEKSVKETDELLKLPKEEQKKHFKTLDDLFELFDDIEPPTKEELSENERKMWYCSLKTKLYLFDLFKGVML